MKNQFFIVFQRSKLQYHKFQDSEADKEVRKLLRDDEIKTLSKLFLKRMQFGTAGLRGRMGPGYNQMNDLVIVQTGQGLLEYLRESIFDLENKGIVIGYDGRYNSKRYMEKDVQK